LQQSMAKSRWWPSVVLGWSFKNHHMKHSSWALHLAANTGQWSVLTENSKTLLLQNIVGTPSCQQASGLFPGFLPTIWPNHSPLVIMHLLYVLKLKVNVRCCYKTVFYVKRDSYLGSRRNWLHAICICVMHDSPAACCSIFKAPQ
jgi:hypothetical protein